MGPELAAVTERMTGEPSFAGYQARDGRSEVSSGGENKSSAVTALMGLAAGAAGVWALDRVDWFLFRREPEEAQQRTRAVRENGEAPAGVLVSRIEDAVGSELSGSGHYLAELGVHYSIGIGPAVGYAFLRDRLPVTGAARGALFGAAMWLLQDEILNPVIGLSARPQDYPWQNHARALAAHLTYGVTTELVLNALESRVDRSAAV